MPTICKRGRKKPRKPKKTENKMIKVFEDRIIRHIKSLFEQQEEYYKPVRVGNLHSNNYIKYGSNGDRNEILSIEEYLDETKPYLTHIISKEIIYGKFY